MRFPVLVGAVLTAAATLAGPASAAPVLLADLATGQVLEAEEATRPWHPASVTKLMTAYVALKHVRTGKIRLDAPLPVSARATTAPPSRIGIKPGQTVTLDDALKILMVKSANDVAIVVAEGIGGSVEKFAAMMNAEAAALGMRESRFLNPHGLQADGQQTSARDMAILARRLLTDFPQHRALFGIGAIKLDDKVMENHNGVIGRYPGATGMKTGFICASGFNVVATARRDGRELIAVVFGQPNAVERTFRTMQLFDDGFARRASGPNLEALPVSAETEAPNMREAICGRKGAATGETSEPAAAAPGEAAVTDPAAVAGPRKLGPREPFEPIVVAIAGAPAVVAKAPKPAKKSAPVPEKATDAETKTAAAAEPVKKPAPKPAPKAEKKETAEADAKAKAPAPAKKPAPKPAPPKPAEERPAPASDTVATAKPDADKPAAAETKEAATLGATPILPSGGILNLPARSPALSDRTR